MNVELNDDELEEMIVLYAAKKFSGGVIVNWFSINEDDDGTHRVNFEVINET